MSGDPPPIHLDTNPGIRAIIDLGTNTVLMVVAERLADGSLTILDDVHAIARLGEGVDSKGSIQPAAMDRVCRQMSEYASLARSFGADSIQAFGTSALRDKEDLIARIMEETGVRLFEVPGSEEARLTFAGAGFGMKLPRRYGVLDIGGGSTELAVGTRRNLEQSASVDVGAVRLTERCFSKLPPDEASVKAATEMIDVLLTAYSTTRRRCPSLAWRGLLRPWRPCRPRPQTSGRMNSTGRYSLFPKSKA